MKTLKLETRSDPTEKADPTLEVRNAVAELRTAADAHASRLTEQVTALTTRLADVETRAARAFPQQEPAGEIPLERRAFSNFLRLGQDRMAAEETRALVVGDDTKGGYLAPADFQTEVIRGIVEISPIRQAVRVGTTGSGSVLLPKLTGRPTASWVGEDEDRSETSMAYGQLEIPMHELACYIDVSLRLLEDSAINVDTEIATELSQEFALKEGSAFSNGDGAKKPVGIQQAAISEVINGHATVLNADKLIALQYALPPLYRTNGSWLMNGTTLGVVRTLKDTSGAYIWQPGIQAGQPSTLLGRPIIEDPTMPDVASGNYPVIFGDFSRGYRIYDRVGMSIMRDPFTQATKGLVRFHARRRVGGAPTLTEALRRLKMSVS